MHLSQLKLVLHRVSIIERISNIYEAVAGFTLYRPTLSPDLDDNQSPPLLHTAYTLWYPHLVRDGGFEWDIALTLI